ncbi:hypothetical protein PGQ11_002661 [Apiospora arundinis]|uniref:Uncharacterized protein n=1 Tax=Apiospora arundinis TaxID=335852 RepID=A0ABR2JIS9_9PEZI
MRAYIRAEIAPFVISTATGPEMLDREKFLDGFAELAMPKVEYGKKESPADRKTRLRVILDVPLEKTVKEQNGSMKKALKNKTFTVYVHCTFHKETLQTQIRGVHDSTLLQRRMGSLISALSVLLID